ncbi:Undecaprenyl phosphate-alpha-4-amino-4-deoxy-L-arabinose arabinosyl transferase [bioreactor metagenome]|uniref:Undecaprenyl phosphate-alpha-4-amino-4-deoxy-L-arabinose arabinosyl transferase n=1 Tax=bioreactor metagenome TaxID=1076179 RepID=A0A645DUD1_9ZZZZ
MLHTVLVVNNFGRFSGSQGDHAKPFYFYLEKLPTLFWPWFPLLPFAVWYALKRVRRKLDSRYLLLLAFLLVPFLLLCIASGKRIVYLLPLYAPMALLCGAFLARLPDKARRLLEQYGRNPAVLWTAGGLFCAALIVFSVLSGRWSMIYPLLAILFLFGCWRMRDIRWRKALGICAFALFFAAIDTSTAPYLNRENSLRPLFEACREQERKGNEIILFDSPERTRGAAYFYLGRNLRVFKRGDRLPENGMLVMRVKDKAMPGKRFADHHRLLSDEEYLKYAKSLN